jgi:4-amino-4-deoxy-L-arabinose transferase-like glycosyltransferase
VKSRYLLLVVGLTLVHAVGASLAPVSGDEAYYWDCSRHLDWSYFDQPPLTIWLMIPFRFLFGETALAVRSPAILAGFLAGLFLLPLVRRLGGTAREAALVYLLLHAQPIFALGFSYTSTDVVMGTAYLGAIWAAVAVAQGHRRAWWGLGVALGIGFLAKFSMVVAFLPAAVALSSPKARGDLKTMVPWAAALTSAFLTAPVWIWGAQHNWDNIVFQLSGRHSPEGIGLKYLLEFVGANLILASPILAVLLVGSCLPAWNRRDPAWRVMVAAAIAPFLFFGLVSLRTRVGAHWGGPGLMVMTVLLVLTGFGGRRMRRLGAAVGFSITGVVLVLALLAPLFLDFEWEYKPRPEKISSEKLARAFGTEELVDGVRQRRDQWAREIGVPPESIYVGSESYTKTHLSAFVSEGELESRFLHIKGGQHGLASLYWYPPEDFAGRRILFFTENPGQEEKLRRHFRRVEIEPPLVVPIGEAGMRTLSLARCEDPLDPRPFLTRLDGPAARDESLP